MQEPSSPSNLLYGVVYLIDNKPIDPNFLNMLRAAVEGGQAQNLPIDMDNPSLLNSLRLETIVDPDADGMQLVARRINLGSLGGDYTVTLKFPKNPKLLWSVGTAQALVNFGRTMLDVSNTQGGNVVYDANPQPRASMGIPYREEYQADFEEIYAEEPKQDKPCPVPKASASKGTNWLKFWTKRQFKPAKHTVDQDTAPQSTMPSSSTGLALSALDIISQQEELEINQLERERAIALEQLKAAILNYVITFNADPSGLVRERLEGKYILTSDRLSPLVVNGDLKLVLPAYDETPIKMPALHRTIYLLFLKHQREGIVLKHIANYRQEIEEIYAMVMPGRDETRAKAAIDNLCDPFNNILTQYISKINRCISNVILNDNIAANYHIKGKKGEPYSISLNPEMITLPKAVK